MDKNKLKYSIKNMAIKAMKDNFLSLSDEEKQKEFCEFLDRNNKLQQDKQELIDYLKSEIQNWKDKIFENSLTEDNLTLALWRSRLITYEKVLNKIEKSDK